MSTKRQITLTSINQCGNLCNYPKQSLWGDLKPLAIADGRRSKKLLHQFSGLEVSVSMLQQTVPSPILRSNASSNCSDEVWSCLWLCSGRHSTATKKCSFPNPFCTKSQKTTSISRLEGYAASGLLLVCENLIKHKFASCKHIN